MKKFLKKNHIKLIRLSIQMIFIILVPVLFSFAFGGIKAFFVAQVQPSRITAAMKLAFFLILFSLLLGRVFCGWICAFGTYNDIIYRIFGRFFKRKIKVSERMDSYLKYIKYAVLLLILVLCFIGERNIIEKNSPWNVFGMLVSLKLRGGYIIAILLLLLITVGAAMIERFFCRYLCPLGAVFSITGKLNILTIDKPREVCGKCRACTNVCPMGIQMYKKDRINSGECIKCMDCTQVCPRANASLAIFNLRIKKNLAVSLVVVLVVLIFLVYKRIMN